MVERLLPNHRYRMTERLDIGRWCICNLVLEVGDTFVVDHYKSKNRVLILTDTGYHNVRASSLRMVVNPAWDHV
jgi:Zn-dependent membrane protease YugP